MKKMFQPNKLSVIVLFGLMALLWLTVTLAIGPPDEAPPFITPGP